MRVAHAARRLRAALVPLDGQTVADDQELKERLRQVLAEAKEQGRLTAADWGLSDVTHVHTLLKGADCLKPAETGGIVVDLEGLKKLEEDESDRLILPIPEMREILHDNTGSQFDSRLEAVAEFGGWLAADDRIPDWLTGGQLADFAEHNGWLRPKDDVYGRWELCAPTGDTRPRIWPGAERARSRSELDGRSYGYLAIVSRDERMVEALLLSLRLSSLAEMPIAVFATWEEALMLTSPSCCAVVCDDSMVEAPSSLFAAEEHARSQEAKDSATRGPGRKWLLEAPDHAREGLHLLGEFAGSSSTLIWLTDWVSSPVHDIRLRSLVLPREAVSLARVIAEVERANAREKRQAARGTSPRRSR